VSDLERLLWRDLFEANLEHDVDHEHDLYDELLPLIPQQRDCE
jgi:hypothetical protein